MKPYATNLLSIEVQRQLRGTITCLAAAAAAMLAACSELTDPRDASDPIVASTSNFALVSAIVFSSSRDNPTALPQAGALEIYLMDADGAAQRRLTENVHVDALAAFSPGGTKIVFDSNRRRAEGEPFNTSDLFVMNTDGTEQAYVTRGSSTTFSPDGKNIAFHASASGTGLPTGTNPGAPTFDSDIFVANLDDLLAGTAERVNMTSSPLVIDDDADWSPDGQTLAFTSRPVTDDPVNAIHTEIYLMNADGTGLPIRLTDNDNEERGPSWSPDGTRMVFLCRIGPPGAGGLPTFEICVMNADGTGYVRLTFNTVFDGTPTFSPDGQHIVFGRNVGPGRQQVYVMSADGWGEMPLTNAPGTSLFPHSGEIRVHVKE